MHNIQLVRDKIGRTVIGSATSTSLTHPLQGLHSSYQRKILIAPLKPHERDLIRAARHATREQRHVVAHYILTQRKEAFLHDLAYRQREAKRLRQQDIVDDENARTRRHSDYLARKAEREQRPATQRSYPYSIVQGGEASAKTFGGQHKSSTGWSPEADKRSDAPAISQLREQQDKAKLDEASHRLFQRDHDDLDDGPEF